MTDLELAASLRSVVGDALAAGQAADHPLLALLGAAALRLEALVEVRRRRLRLYASTGGLGRAARRLPPKDSPGR